MIDLFEAVRDKIPEEYRDRMDIGINKINKFVNEETWLWDEYDWRRIPWFDKDINNEFNVFSCGMYFNNNSKYRFYVRLRVSNYTGSVTLDGSFWIGKVNKASYTVDLLDDSSYDLIGEVFRYICYMFHKALDKPQISKGDVVYCYDWCEILRGVIKEQPYGEVYKVDFGDGYARRVEASRLIPATHWERER